MSAGDRQKKYIKGLRDEGLCVQCRAESPDRVLCARCTKQRRIYQRKKHGNKAWRAGHRGRPIIHK